MGDISKNFSMHEFINSTVAKDKKIDNTPSEDVKRNIKKLVEKVLQPLSDYMGIPCFINSGYRCPKLNAAVNGASTSAHMLGTAVDINFGSRALNKKAYEWIKNNCKFRQLIWEKGDDTGPQWIHVEYREGDLKNQVLRIK